MVRHFSWLVLSIWIVAIQMSSATAHSPCSDQALKGSSPVKTSVYIGNNLQDIRDAEHWLGRDLDAIQIFIGSASWADWLGSMPWVAGVLRNTEIDVLWSLPLIPTGASLEAAAAGKYNVEYRAQAKQLLEHYPNDAQIYVRVGWEFNGKGWTPWSAVGKPDAYAGAFRQLVGQFRAVSQRFVFEWTPNIGDVGMDPETAYPGDGYVDVIGLDFYYDAKYNSSDPIQAWLSFVRQRWGLQWHQNFAARHHKPTAYAEWGVNSDTAGPYIALARKWFDAHDVIYQNYWNSNAGFRGKLSDNRLPRASAAYRKAFATLPRTGPVSVNRNPACWPAASSSATKLPQ